MSVLLFAGLAGAVALALLTRLGRAREDDTCDICGAPLESGDDHLCMDCWGASQW